MEYLSIDALELSRHLRQPQGLSRRIEELSATRRIIVAVVDSSITAPQLRSFRSHLDTTGIPYLSFSTDAEFLEALDRLSRQQGMERKDINKDSESILLSIARSPHNQMAIWPTISVHHLAQESISMWIADAIEEITALPLIGLINYLVDPVNGRVIWREFGLSTFAIDRPLGQRGEFHTQHAEQLIRAILDLPLGDVSRVEPDEHMITERIDVDPRIESDPLRPFLHLFARNPRLKIEYVDGSPIKGAIATLSAPTREGAIVEMEHVREYMLGY